MNILLTIGLIVLISGITVLSVCAVIASSRDERETHANTKKSHPIERRKNKSCTFPIICSDGSMVYFDRRIRSDHGYV